jgi:hypothetical protein
VYGRGWTLEREIEYEEWVDANMTEDFFIRHKIPVDCADVPYAARWIYARIAHLPAAATTKDGKLIGHWSMNWSRRLMRMAMSGSTGVSADGTHTPIFLSSEMTIVY